MYINSSFPEFAHAVIKVKVLISTSDNILILFEKKKKNRFCILFLFIIYYYFFVLFSEEVFWLDMACESSAWQTVPMKSQVWFYLKNKKNIN